MIHETLASTVRRVVVTIVVTVAVALHASAACALTPLKTFCRVKGQQENVLQQIGLVVGLKGTGDGAYPPTMRMLAQIMQKFGSPVQQVKGVPLELKDSKNVAMVLVTATIPAHGAQRGCEVDCRISAIGPAKSLAGGELFTTAMVSQDPNNPQVYAIAQGRLTLSNAAQTTTAQVYKGCRMEEDFYPPFVKDGKFTLVLNPAYVDFEVAQRMAEEINASGVGSQSVGAPIAQAINAGNIEVAIPQAYLSGPEGPANFLSQVVALAVSEPRVGPRVVINERAGTIVISGDTEIGAAAITCKNITVDTSGGSGSASHFVAVDPKNESPTLKSLVAALNAVKAPPEDVIEIIKLLHHDGKLRAQLIIQ